MGLLQQKWRVIWPYRQGVLPLGAQSTHPQYIDHKLQGWIWDLVVFHKLVHCWGCLSHHRPPYSWSNTKFAQLIFLTDIFSQESIIKGSTKLVQYPNASCFIHIKVSWETNNFHICFAFQTFQIKIKSDFPYTSWFFYIFICKQNFILKSTIC